MTDEQRESAARRGRKPLGERPMTAAERKRKSRAGFAASGRIDVLLQLGGPLAAFVDAVAPGMGGRSRVVQDAVERGLWQLHAVLAEMTAMEARGEGRERIEAYALQHLSLLPSHGEGLSPEAKAHLKTWREVT